MRIGITGVTGLIGKRLATAALAAGHEVVGFSRRPWTGAPFVPLADRRFLTLPSAPSPGDLSGVDAVVHLAIAAQTSSAALAHAVNFDGTRRLYQAAVVAGVGRFVFASTPSAHADAVSTYGKSKYAAEQLLRDDPRVIIVRPGLVYGESADGLLGRAAGMAGKLRFFPVFGGTMARAQLVHVDDFCRGLLTVLEMADPPRDLSLAEPDTRPLGEIVSERAEALHGVRARPINIGLKPARAALRMADRLHLPLPVSEENLDGIEQFRVMDTRPSLEAIGLELRSETVTPQAVGPVPEVEPARLLLVGAGRIGLVHALTALHHHRLVLAGVVDLDKAATGRLVSLLGRPVPRFTDLDEAIRTTGATLAIVATPPSSHVPLTRKLIEAGLDVLIEKPLAARAEDRRELEALLAERPGRHVAVGYVGPVLPHLVAAGERLRAGRYGTPMSFDGWAFVSRIEEGAAERKDMWELDPAVGGGGALISLGVHVLSMIDVLLGPISIDHTVVTTSGTRRIEDAAALELTAGGVKGRFATAWHLPGFNMPDNTLRITTDRGVVLLTTSCAAFLGNDGEVDVIHQVDADTGFDLAPLDAGGAFWTEQDALARAADAGNTPLLAERIESAIEGAYAGAEQRRGAPLAQTTRHLSPAPRTQDIVADLRGAPDDVRQALRGTGAVLIGSPVSDVDRQLVMAPGAIVAVPDAPAHFRTLTNDGPVALIRELGPGNLTGAATGLAPLRAASAVDRPWEALLVLLRAELRRLPRAYRGTVVVDAYLVDLATANDHVAPMAAAIADIRGRLPGARVGLEVNAVGRFVPHVPALPPLDIVVALATPAGTALDALREALPETTEVVLKTGTVPVEVSEVAAARPELWHSGDGRRLVVDWAGAGLADARRADLDAARAASGAAT